LNTKEKKWFFGFKFYITPPNNRVGVFDFEHSNIYAPITYNLPDCELVFDEIIVPVSDHHAWKLQLLAFDSYFKDTQRRIRTGYIDCQIWKLARKR